MQANGECIIINKVDKDTSTRDILMIRSLAVILGITLPVLGIIHEMSGDKNDPMIFRVIISCCAFAVLVMSYFNEWMKKNILLAALFVVYLLMAWISYLVCINDLKFQYVIGLIVVIFTGTPIIKKSAHLKYYLSYASVCILLATLLAVNPDTNRYLLIVTLTTMVGALFFILDSRIKMQEKLKSNENLLRNVFNETADALFLMDSGSYLTIDCNHRAAKMFEVEDEEDLIGINGSALHKNELNVDETNKIRTTIQNTGQWNEEYQYVTHSGNEFWGNMAINAIELGEQKSQWLVRIADITEKKIAENEIRDKNKKISESINYAQRIQETIMPTAKHLEKIFPDSFIYYKAKDVVSGDFPWMTVKEDNIYVAAVDCTGHGVPGAFMSMIGYFQLNDIIKTRGINEPASILDNLHIGVNETLKQEENIESHDGMDIALCGINLKKMELQFAAAHRPLYYLSDGEITEIRGNRFPIGGVQYSRMGREIKFTNHVVNIKKDDTVFFFSDGLTDQIGGPNKRKFMSSQVIDIIMNNKELPMTEICGTFDEKFTEWMGNYKQIDDVILIGIRF